MAMTMRAYAPSGVVSLGKALRLSKTKPATTTIATAAATTSTLLRDIGAEASIEAASARSRLAQPARVMLKCWTNVMEKLGLLTLLLGLAACGGMAPSPAAQPKASTESAPASGAK